jgi:hypothetical protein
MANAGAFGMSANFKPVNVTSPTGQAGYPVPGRSGPNASQLHTANNSLDLSSLDASSVA